MSLVGSIVGGLGKKKDDKEGAGAEEEKKGSEEKKDAGGKAGEDSKSRYFFPYIKRHWFIILPGYLVRSVQ